MLRSTAGTCCVICSRLFWCQWCLARCSTNCSRAGQRDPAAYRDRVGHPDRGRDRGRRQGADRAACRHVADCDIAAPYHRLWPWVVARADTWVGCGGTTHHIHRSRYAEFWARLRPCQNTRLCRSICRHPASRPRPSASRDLGGLACAYWVNFGELVAAGRLVLQPPHLFSSGPQIPKQIRAHFAHLNFLRAFGDPISAVVAIDVFKRFVP